ncbi:unnamed protein product, partial [Staurois parvus]
MKGTRGISWGPLLTLGPWAVPDFPNGQSASDPDTLAIIQKPFFCLRLGSHLCELRLMHFSSAFSGANCTFEH